MIQIIKGAVTVSLFSLLNLSDLKEDSESRSRYAECLVTPDS